MALPSLRHQRPRLVKVRAENLGRQFPVLSVPDDRGTPRNHHPDSEWGYHMVAEANSSRVQTNEYWAHIFAPGLILTGPV